MASRNEKFRFWLPVVMIGLLAAYSGQKLVRSHVAPKVDSVNYTFTRKLSARRGTICDSRGRSLVKSVPIWEYRLDPVSLTNGVVRRRGEKPQTPAQIVRRIASSLGLDFRDVLAKSHNTRNTYQFLARSSDKESHDALIDSTRVRGLVIEDRQERRYLQNRRLSHVLGSVNAESVGSAGIELKYQKELEGIPGEIRGMKDARGRELYDKRIVSVPAVPGHDIYLTVDQTVQYESEYALARGVREFGAGSGWCVVMDARNAAVLAMASLPDFDPRNFGSAGEAAKVNRVTNFTYEPGSVMKVITTAACIDSGFATPQRMYSTARNDDRYYRLPGDGSHKWEPFMSVADAVVHSSNIVIGKLGYDFGPQRLWEYMRRFGFGQRTGIELPGEEVGILRNWRNWDKATWSRAPIGQGVSVTAIQLASAYQAIANDGVRMQPHIVSKVVAANGSVAYEYRDKMLGRVISADAARQMRRIMTGVASPGGTARRAAVKGYSVAGKTGTAQKVIGRSYAPGLYRATFIGMLPAGDPRLVILVTLDFDSVQKYHQGGNSSGVIFRKLATVLTGYMEIPGDRADELEDIDPDDDTEMDEIMDNRFRERDWCD